MSEESSEFEGVLEAVKLMAVSARTAPKPRGIDEIVVKIISDPRNIEALAKVMENLATEEKPFFRRDAENVRLSDAIILIGLRNGGKTMGFNCGGCGYESCKALEAHRIEGREFKGPSCIFQILSLGIALGSAVKTASMLNLDNRIMYTVGVAARNMGLLDADIIIGIPVSARGKNIYFDRVFPR